MAVTYSCGNGHTSTNPADALMEWFCAECVINPLDGLTDEQILQISRIFDK